jgi:hypothetical protein
MDRQGGVLVRPQYGLQAAFPYMLGDLIGERPRHATPFDSRGDSRAYAVDEQARRELHSAWYRRAIGGWKAPCAYARIVHGNDLLLREIAGLVDARMLGEIGRRSSRIAVVPGALQITVFMMQDAAAK